MAGPSKNQLLQEWCIWSFKQNDANDTIGDTARGNIIQRENSARNDQYKNIWYIPGTWGQTEIDDRDRITVKAGTQLFIVAASSHTTGPELPDNQPPTEDNLRKHLDQIDRLWSHPALYIRNPNDREFEEVDLKKARTAVFDVNIDPASQYTVLTKGERGEAGVSGNQKMMSSGMVSLFEPDPGETLLEILGMSRKNKDVGKRGEKEYNVHVRYKITVTSGA